MFNKILVPLDGSVLSEKVLPYAVRLANRLNGQILLMRAVEVPSLMVDSTNREMEIIKQAEEYLEQVVSTITNESNSPHMEAARVTHMVVYGDAVKEISELAPFEKVDLIIMTTHGRSGFSRLVLGSVAGQILRRSSVPVMLVRPQEQKHEHTLVETLSGAEEPYSDCFDGIDGSIVLPLEGTEIGAAAIEPAAQLALGFGATLHLLSIVYPASSAVYTDMVELDYSDAEIKANNEQRVAGAEGYLAKVAEELAYKEVKTVKTVKLGATENEIAEYALEVGASAIVMATHARGEMGHLFLGSIAEDVMRKSHLPVLMIPTHAHLKETQQKSHAAAR
ncbi:MAG TPA: universal stress protein [Chloroflexia bacterium]|nr:universal stress protein [Chloroflexia bacterium]